MRFIKIGKLGEKYEKNTIGKLFGENYLETKTLKSKGGRNYCGCIGYDRKRRFISKSA